MALVIFGAQMFCQLVNLPTEQGSTEFRTPLCVILATPLVSIPSSSSVVVTEQFIKRYPKHVKSYTSLSYPSFAFYTSVFN